MFLHAWRLQFMHPGSGERLELLANLPVELAQFAAAALGEAAVQPGPGPVLCQTTDLTEPS
jgi:hypothetical protein